MAEPEGSELEDGEICEEVNEDHEGRRRIDGGEYFHRDNKGRRHRHSRRSPNYPFRRTISNSRYRGPVEELKYPNSGGRPRQIHAGNRKRRGGGRSMPRRSRSRSRSRQSRSRSVSNSPSEDNSRSLSDGRGGARRRLCNEERERRPVGERDHALGSSHHGGEPSGSDRRVSSDSVVSVSSKSSLNSGRPNSEILKNDKRHSAPGPETMSRLNEPRSHPDIENTKGVSNGPSPSPTTVHRPVSSLTDEESVPDQAVSIASTEVSSLSSNRAGVSRTASPEGPKKGNFEDIVSEEDSIISVEVVQNAGATIEIITLESSDEEVTLVTSLPLVPKIVSSEPSTPPNSCPITDHGSTPPGNFPITNHGSTPPNNCSIINHVSTPTSCVTTDHGEDLPEDLLNTPTRSAVSATSSSPDAISICTEKSSDWQSPLSQRSKRRLERNSASCDVGRSSAQQITSGSSKAEQQENIDIDVVDAQENNSNEDSSDEDDIELLKLRTDLLFSLLAKQEKEKSAKSSKSQSPQVGDKTQMQGSSKMNEQNSPSMITRTVIQDVEEKTTRITIQNDIISSHPKETDEEKEIESLRKMLISQQERNREKKRNETNMDDVMICEDEAPPHVSLSPPSSPPSYECGSPGELMSPRANFSPGCSRSHKRKLSSETFSPSFQAENPFGLTPNHRVVKLTDETLNISPPMSRLPPPLRITKNLPGNDLRKKLLLNASLRKSLNEAQNPFRNIAPLTEHSDNFHFPEFGVVDTDWRRDPPIGGMQTNDVNDDVNIRRTVTFDGESTTASSSVTWTEPITVQIPPNVNSPHPLANQQFSPSYPSHSAFPTTPLAQQSSNISPSMSHGSPFSMHANQRDFPHDSPSSLHVVIPQSGPTYARAGQSMSPVLHASAKVPRMSVAGGRFSPSAMQGCDLLMASSPNQPPQNNSKRSKRGKRSRFGRKSAGNNVVPQTSPHVSPPFNEDRTRRGTFKSTFVPEANNSNAATKSPQMVNLSSKRIEPSSTINPNIKVVRLSSKPASSVNVSTTSNASASSKATPIVVITSAPNINLSARQVSGSVNQIVSPRSDVNSSKTGASRTTVMPPKAATASRSNLITISSIPSKASSSTGTDASLASSLQNQQKICNVSPSNRTPGTSKPNATQPAKGTPSVSGKGPTATLKSVPSTGEVVSSKATPASATNSSALKELSNKQAELAKINSMIASREIQLDSTSKSAEVAITDVTPRKQAPTNPVVIVLPSEGAAEHVTSNQPVASSLAPSQPASASEPAKLVMENVTPSPSVQPPVSPSHTISSQSLDTEKEVVASYESAPSSSLPPTTLTLDSRLAESVAEEDGGSTKSVPVPITPKPMENNGLNKSGPSTATPAKATSSVKSASALTEDGTAGATAPSQLLSTPPIKSVLSPISPSPFSTPQSVGSVPSPEPSKLALNSKSGYPMPSKLTLNSEPAESVARNDNSNKSVPNAAPLKSTLSPELVETIAGIESVASLVRSKQTSGSLVDSGLALAEETSSGKDGSTPRSPVPSTITSAEDVVQAISTASDRSANSKAPVSTTGPSASGKAVGTAIATKVNSLPTAKTNSSLVSSTMTDEVPVVGKVQNPKPSPVKSSRNKIVEKSPSSIPAKGTVGSTSVITADQQNVKKSAPAKSDTTVSANSSDLLESKKQSTQVTQPMTNSVASTNVSQTASASKLPSASQPEGRVPRRRTISQKRRSTSQPAVRGKGAAVPTKSVEPVNKRVDNTKSMVPAPQRSLPSSPNAIRPFTRLIIPVRENDSTSDSESEDNEVEKAKEAEKASVVETTSEGGASKTFQESLNLFLRRAREESEKKFEERLKPAVRAAIQSALAEALPKKQMQPVQSHSQKTIPATIEKAVASTASASVVPTSTTSTTSSLSIQKVVAQKPQQKSSGTGNHKGSSREKGGGGGVVTDRSKSSRTLANVATSKSVIEDLTKKIVESRDQLSLSAKEKALLQTRQKLFHGFREIHKSLQQNMRLVNLDQSLETQIASLQNQLDEAKRKQQAARSKATALNHQIKEKCRSLVPTKAQCMTLSREVKTLGEKVIGANTYKVTDLFEEDISDVTKTIETLSAKQPQSVQLERGTIFPQLLQNLEIPPELLPAIAANNANSIAPVLENPGPSRSRSASGDSSSRTVLSDNGSSSGGLCKKCRCEVESEKESVLSSPSHVEWSRGGCLTRYATMVSDQPEPMETEEETSQSTSASAPMEHMFIFGLSVNTNQTFSSFMQITIPLDLGIVGETGNSRRLDPMVPLCPDGLLKGTCTTKECPHQHI